MSLPEGIASANIDGFLKKEFLYRFSIDSWIEDEMLGMHTFPTKIVPMTCEEGKALLQFHKHVFTNPDFIDSDPILINLVHKIDAAIAGVGGLAFIKMNHRSPKDVALFKDNERAKELLKYKLDSISADDTSSQVIAWVNSVLESLSVNNGRFALTLLAKSFRVSSDLNADVEYADFFRSKIIVRQFKKVDPAFEFRAFVSKGKLTAISQYESGIYFENLVRRHEEVKNKIVNFWESIKQYIKLEDYVIDFCMVNTVMEDEKHAHTSACMFTWKDDRDIILNGPFTFRYLSSPPPDSLSYVPPFWVNFIEKYLEKRDNRGGKLNTQLILAGAISLAAIVAIYLIKNTQK